MPPRTLDNASLQEHVVATDLREVTFDTLSELAHERVAVASRPCPVCRGVAGPIVDLGELYSGKTLVIAHSATDEYLELRQVSSTEHGVDLDSVLPMDAIQVFDRLRKVDEYLLAQADSRFLAQGDGRRGLLTISKHRRPGQHGSQRLRFYRDLPDWLRRQRARDRARGGSLPARLELHNPTELTLGEFRGGLTALIPEQPTTPLETIIYFRPSARGNLSDLDGNQLWGLAQAIREVSGALRLELQARDHDGGYRWRLVTGPDQDIYLRLVPTPEIEVDDGPALWAAYLRDHLGLAG